VIFLAVALIGVLGLVVTAFVLRETRPPEQRVPIALGHVLRGYLTLLGDRNFLGVAFIGGFGLASFFAFLAGSSFVYIDHFGLTPTQYSLAFAVNAVAFIGVAQLTGRIGRLMGLRAMVRAALTYYMAVTVALLVVTLAGVDNLAVLMIALFCAFGGIGLVIPSVMVLALEDYGPRAGMAAALMGTLQLATGAATIAAVGAMFDGTARPMVAAIATCAVAAFAISRATLARPRPLAAAAE
jgi:DHA1 family bicyclomycin/chloramphenicol resistance-like MFS transporter